MSNSKIIEHLNEKEARYTTAIESLQELLEKDNEIEAVRHVSLYLKEQRKEVQKNQIKQAYNIKVYDAEQC